MLRSISSWYLLQALELVVVWGLITYKQPPPEGGKHLHHRPRPVGHCSIGGGGGDRQEFARCEGLSKMLMDTGLTYLASKRVPWRWCEPPCAGVQQFFSLEPQRRSSLRGFLEAEKASRQVSQTRNMGMRELQCRCVSRYVCMQRYKYAESSGSPTTQRRVRMQYAKDEDKADSLFMCVPGTAPPRPCGMWNEPADATPCSCVQRVVPHWFHRKAIGLPCKSSPKCEALVCVCGRFCEHVWNSHGMST